MRHTLTIAAREMRDQSFIFIAAVVLALIPFAAALFVPANQGSRPEVIAILGFVVAANFAIVVAMMLGATMVGRELSDRRLSFYFSRPLPAASIWFGKLVAATVTTAIAFAIIALPAGITARQAWMSTWTLIVPWRLGTWTISPFASIGLAALLGLVIVLLAHVGSTAVRSRSPLVFFDLAAIGLCMATGWLMIRPLAEGRAVFVVLAYVAIAAIVVLLTLIASGAWQMARGRVDAQRNHYELSKFVWAAMAILLILGSAFTAWFVMVGPSDLRPAFARQLPRGSWATLSGAYRWRADYSPVLLYNFESGQSMRLTGIRWQIASSLDGNSLAWTRDALRDREIYFTSLGPRPSTRATGIAVGPFDTFVLSDDGKEVAILERQTVSIYDVASRQLMGSARIPYQDVRAFFVGPERIRMISRWSKDAPASAGAEGIHIAEFDGRTRTITRMGDLDLGEHRVVFSANAAGSLLLVQHWDRKQGWTSGRELLLVDGRSASVVANLGRPGRGLGASFLSDGRIVTAGATDRRGLLRVFSPDGVLVRSVELGIADSAYRPSEVAPNRVAVWLRQYSRPNPVPGTPFTDTLALVDLQQGRIVKTETEVSPGFMLPDSFYQGDPRLVTPEANRPLLLNDRNQRLWKWDPVTGQKTRIAGE